MAPRRSLSRVGLTWLLCLLAWRGPVPVVHTHSLDSHDLSTNDFLAAHAVHYHSQEIGHGQCGWHLHFVMPGEGMPGEEVPAEGMPSDQSVPSLAWPCALLEHVGTSSSYAYGLSVTSLEAGQCAFLQLAHSCGRLASGCIEHQGLAQAPLSPKRISPRASLCVARC